MGSAFKDLPLSSLSLGVGFKSLLVLCGPARILHVPYGETPKSAILLNPKAGSLDLQTGKNLSLSPKRKKMVLKAFLIVLVIP